MTHQKLIICGWLIEGLKIARKWWLTIGKPPSRSRTKAAPNPFLREKKHFLHNDYFYAFRQKSKWEMIYRDSIQVLVLVTLLFYFYTHFQLQSAKEISKGKLLLISFTTSQFFWNLELTLKRKPDSSIIRVHAWIPWVLSGDYLVWSDFNNLKARRYVRSNQDRCGLVPFYDSLSIQHRNGVNCDLIAKNDEKEITLSLLKRYFLDPVRFLW